MLQHLSEFLRTYYGPFRLLGSNLVLILLSIYAAFAASVFLLPALSHGFPKDRGREFSIGSQAAVGKPTGTGLVFICIFAVVTLLMVPLNSSQTAILTLTLLAMLSGFMDDRSEKPWGEYRKALIDLVLSFAASAALFYLRKPAFWLPFVSGTIPIGPLAFISISTIVIWVSINTTNCSDGVDGLSGTLVLLALVVLGVLFYFVLGHVGISTYLLVPHIRDGAGWAIMTFALAGSLLGYLWHNAYPSKLLMGDAGSRALGFFIGACVMALGNPALLLAVSFIILINGGTGLVKVALLRFFKIRIFADVRFPLHDHMKKHREWSSTQILLKYVILQLLTMVGLIGVIFKVR
jgi:phospho-N-acetylmuramoyl-pentapeptide-transferase